MPVRQNNTCLKRIIFKASQQFSFHENEQMEGSRDQRIFADALYLAVEQWDASHS